LGSTVEWHPEKISMGKTSDIEGLFSEEDDLSTDGDVVLP